MKDNWNKNEPNKYLYPILEKVFLNYISLPHKVDDLFLVCCQHLLEPQSKMFERFIKFGFKPEKIFVLGKIYSTNKEIFFELNKLGIKVMQPDFQGGSFDKEHKKNCETLADLIPPNAQCVLLDDGAQLIEAFINKNKKVLFGVEQTSSGFRKLENKMIPFAIVNVARSTTKLVQESPFIANDLFERINLYLKNQKIENPSILIVGLGPIGKSLLNIFNNKNYIVEGFDIILGHKDLMSSINRIKPNIIIGATGSSILNKEDIFNLISDKSIALVSASSSDREFPVFEFRSTKEIHIDVKYKNITFVNNGFPLSFTGNRNEILPIEIEKTICLLMGSVFDGVIGKISNNNGLVDVTESLDKLINF